MNELCCPKGHEELEQIFKGSAGINSIYHCYRCSRRYLDIDCVSSPKKNQPDRNFDETIGIEEKTSIESQQCEHDLEEVIFTYPRPGGAPGIQGGYRCKKCGFIPKIGDDSVKVYQMKKESKKEPKKEQPEFFFSEKYALDKALDESFKKLESRCEHDYSLIHVDHVKNLSRSLCKNCGKELISELQPEKS